MKILLTGASGLIGKNLGQALVLNGHSVRAITRNLKTIENLPFPCEGIEWKDYHKEFPLEALEQIDAVIHLMGEPIAEGRWSESKKKSIYESRVVSTRNLCKAIHRATQSKIGNITTAILGSAIGYYGDGGQQILIEDAPAGKDFLSLVCKDWEQSFFELKNNSEIRSVALRTSIVLSGQGGALTKMLPAFRNGIGGSLGSGSQWMSWIHIEDLVQMFLSALNNLKMNGVYNALSPSPVTNMIFSKTLSEVLNKSMGLKVPALALKLAMGDMAEILLTGQNASAKKVLDTGFIFKYPELKQALNEICNAYADGSHEFYSEQWVNAPIESVFKFFSDEKNLETLTPDFLNFQVLKKSTPEIQKGTLIDYQLKLYGVPMQWQTLIADWNPNHSFVDTQLSGPYQKWHHTHQFKTMGQGTLICDRVLYKVPMGGVGDLFAGWKITSDIEKIFAYRQEKIRTLFTAHNHKF